MKFILLLLSFSFSYTLHAQWKGKYDTTKIVGLICKDKDCSGAIFFRGYFITYLPTKSEMRMSIQQKSKTEFPNNRFLSEKGKVMNEPITYYFYQWR